MKKLAFIFAVFSLCALASCHYGQEEAKSTLERNEEYKGEKAGYSVNRAGGDAPKEAAGDTLAAAPAAAPADSTSK